MRWACVATIALAAVGCAATPDLTYSESGDGAGDDGGSSGSVGDATVGDPDSQAADGGSTTDAAGSDAAKTDSGTKDAAADTAPPPWNSCPKPPSKDLKCCSSGIVCEGPCDVVVCNAGCRLCNKEQVCCTKGGTPSFESCVTFPATCP